MIFLAVKKKFQFFFLHISFCHESSVFEKTCVKREIDPDAVVLDLCFLCVCVYVCVCVYIFGHHSVNVCTCNLQVQCL